MSVFFQSPAALVHTLAFMYEWKNACRIFEEIKSVGVFWMASPPLQWLSQWFCQSYRLPTTLSKIQTRCEGGWPFPVVANPECIKSSFCLLWKAWAVSPPPPHLLSVCFSFMFSSPSLGCIHPSHSSLRLRPPLLSLRPSNPLNSALKNMVDEGVAWMRGVPAAKASASPLVPSHTIRGLILQ